MSLNFLNMKKPSQHRKEKSMANKIKEKTDVQVVLLRQLNELREKQLKLPVRDVKRYTKLSNAICDTAKILLTYF